MSPSPQLQQYLLGNAEEPYYILKTNNPGFFGVPDEYDPDHFIPWVHPFTSMIAGPTGTDVIENTLGVLYNTSNN
jgi:hypothetical protein